MTQKISNSVLITLIIVAGIFIFSAVAVIYLNSTIYAKTVSSSEIAAKITPSEQEISARVTAVFRMN